MGDNPTWGIPRAILRMRYPERTEQKGPPVEDVLKGCDVVLKVLAGVKTMEQLEQLIELGRKYTENHPPGPCGLECAVHGLWWVGWETIQERPIRIRDLEVYKLQFEDYFRSIKQGAKEVLSAAR